MSEYYKPHRNPNWNYGGQNWRLSRSKIDLFMECPRCFYIDNKLGVARPRGPAFTLNSAVDELLKKEFDHYRSEGQPHPLMKKYGINAVPFKHEDMDKWRDALRGGVTIFHEQTGLNISGGIDDIWVNPDTNELYVVDYKSTSKNGKLEVLSDTKWENQYKRQMEVYQWLLRQNGFTVSNTSYFFYVNAIKDLDSFNGKLEFDTTIIPYDGNDSWIENTLLEIKKVLDEEKIPKCNPDCDFCRYIEAVNKVVREHEEKNRSEEKTNPDTLF
jgi:hypothetical protein